MADLKKNSFSNSTNSQYFFMKISWIGPWLSRIDLCGPEAVQHKLKNSLKTQKMHFLPVFELTSDSIMTIMRPYRLSHTNVLRINQFYELKELTNFREKVLRNGGM